MPKITVADSRLLVAIAVLLFGADVAAQRPAAYPNRPIRLIIANTPGSAVDVLSRSSGIEQPIATAMASP